MVEITLFKVDLEGSSFDAVGPLVGQTTATDTAERAKGPGGTGGKGRGAAVLVGLVALVTIAIAIRRRRTVPDPHADR